METDQQTILENDNTNSNTTNEIKQTDNDSSSSPTKQLKIQFQYDDLPVGANKPQETFNGNIDELPVGASNKNQFLTEYPEGKYLDFQCKLNKECILCQGFDQAKIVLDQKEEETGPLATRVKSKVWKTRQLAFEELIKKFDESTKDDPIFDEFAGDLVKFIADSNPGAQEKALVLMKNYFDKFQSLGPIDPKEAVKILIDKVIAPGKPNTKKIAFEIHFFIFEKAEKNQIFEALIECINHKMQKTSIAGIQTVVELLKAYGPKKLDYLKPFFTHMEKLAGSTVSAQRAEAMNFYKQAFLFLGEALKPFIAKLKKQQVEELEKFYEENSKNLPKPSKVTEEATTPNTNSNERGGGGGGVITQIDPYDISDPVEIFHKFNEHWTEKVLTQAKWSDKKQMLDDFITAASVPKIANTNFHHIHSMLKKLLNDSNVVVVTLAIKIYGILAKGLRKYFSGTCKIIISYILAKFKEKKTQVTEETAKTLENFLYCINPDDVLEDIKEALNDKTASVKQNTLLWLEKHFEKMAKTPEKCTSLFKHLLPLLKKLLDDSLAEVRDATMNTLAKFKLILGDNIIGSSYDDIASQKLTKILDLSTKINNKFSGAGSVTAKSHQGSFKNDQEEEKEDKSRQSQLDSKKNLPGARKDSRDKEEKKEQLPAKSSIIPGKPSIIGAGKSRQPAQSTKAEKIQEDELEGMCLLSADDAELKLKELGLSDSIANGLGNSEWHEKKKALTEFANWIDQNNETLKEYLEYILRLLKAKLKEWKESNMNTLKDTLAIVMAITKSSKFTLTKKSFHVLVPFIVNNIGDTKYTDTCCTIVTNYLEAISPKFIIHQIITLVQNSKPSTKLIIETTNLLIKLLELITVKFLPLKDTIEFGKFVLSNSNAQVRTAGNKLFIKLYEQIGSSINDYLNDVNPQTLKGLQTEFEKITPVNLKDLDKLIKINIAKDAIIQAEKNELNVVDNSTKGDISKDIEKILKKLSDSDWKIRKEALEYCENILQQNHNRILPNGLNEFVGLLKGRLQDPNKSLVKNFILFTGKFISALGRESRQYAKILLFPLTANLSDKQASIRADTVTTLDKFAAEIGADTIINFILPSLSQENPELRSEIINWTLKNQDVLGRVDIKGNIPTILAILQDKTKEIRNLGERLIEKCILTIGITPFLNVVKDLKPAIQKDIKPIIDKYNTSLNNEIEDNLNDTGIMNKSMKKSPSEAIIRLSKPLKVSDKTHDTKQQNDPKTSIISHKKPLASSGNITSGHFSNSAANHGFDGSQTKNNLSIAGSTTTHGNSNQPQSILHITGQKVKRLEEDSINPWSTNELNDELVEKLRENLKKNVSLDLYTKLFSFDARKHLDAVNLLKKASIQEMTATIDNLDLIFKWIFLRLWDNGNLDLIKEIIDYLAALTTSLETNKYKILDWEMYVLASCLMRLFGKFTADIKDNLHKIWHKLGAIYSSQKVVGIFAQNLDNRESLVQIDMLDIITEIIQLYGKDSISTYDIKLYSQYLISQDEIIQKSAHNLFIELGKLYGENLYKTLEGPSAQYYYNMMQFNKKLSLGLTNLNSGRPNNILSPRGSAKLAEVNDNGQNLNNQIMNNGQMNASISSSISDMKQQSQQTNNNNNSNAQSTQDDSGKSAFIKVDEDNFEKCIEYLKDENISNKLDALLFIHDIAASENDNDKNFLKNKSNSLLESLSISFKTIFNKARNDIPTKFIHYFLNILHKLCSIKLFMKSINEEHLYTLTNDVLNQLLSEDDNNNLKQQQERNDYEIIIKTLNSTMLRILENSNINYIFCVLFDLIIKYKKINQFSKIIGLIIKCILKLNKNLVQIYHELNPSLLFLRFYLYIDEFYHNIDVDQTNNNNDLVIQIIKNILFELVKIYKTNIWEYYKVFDKQHLHDVYIRKWLSIICKSYESKTLNNSQPNDSTLPTTKKDDNSNQGQSHTNNSQVNNNEVQDQDQGQGKDNKSNEKIPKICMLIESIKTNPDVIDTTLNNLYDEIIKYPDLNLGIYFKDYSQIFIDYVTASLERINYQRNNPYANEGLPKVAFQDVKYLFKPLVPIDSQANTKETNQNTSTNEGENSDVKLSQTSNSLICDENDYRLTLLKMRYGNFSCFNKNATHVLDTNHSQSGISGGDSSSSVDRNNIKAVNNYKSGINTVMYSINGDNATTNQNTKSVETILQKLNEINLKMQNIILANKLN